MREKTLTRLFIFSLLLALPLFVFAKKSEKPPRVSKTNLTQTGSSLTSNERLVMETLRGLYDKEVTFYKTVGGEYYGNLEELRSAGLIDKVLASSVKYGYRFNIERTTQTDGYAYFSVQAKPVLYPKNGRRSFYFDARCIMNGADKQGEDVTNIDPVIETCTAYLLVESERDVIEALRHTLPDAEDAYRIINCQWGKVPCRNPLSGNYAGDLPVLYELGLINRDLGSQTYKNSNFDGESVAVWEYVPSTFCYKTVPLFNLPYLRSFYVDQTRVVRGVYGVGRYGEATDPPIED